MPYKDPEKQREANKKWYEENKEKKRESNKKWREENPEYSKKWAEENPEKRREINKKWEEENKEKRAEYRKKWAEENPEKLRESSKKWEEENKEERAEYKNKWRKEKYHTDPCYKLRVITSVMVWGALKEGKGGESILPYVDWNSYEEYKEHLESQFEDWMTWENHGPVHPTERRWHIDHIKPQSVLLEGVTSMDDPKFRECWTLENLRPLEARENMIKGNKIIDE